MYKRQDLYGTIELIVFPKTYEEYAQMLKADNIVIVEGKISIKEDENAKVICERIKPLKESDIKSNYKMCIRDRCKQRGC